MRYQHQPLQRNKQSEQSPGRNPLVAHLEHPTLHSTRDMTTETAIPTDRIVVCWRVVVSDDVVRLACHQKWRIEPFQLDFVVVLVAQSPEELSGVDDDDESNGEHEYVKNDACEENL